MTQLELIHSELRTFIDHLDHACDALNRMDDYAHGCLCDIDKIKPLLNRAEKKARKMYNNYAQYELNK